MDLKIFALVPFLLPFACSSSGSPSGADGSSSSQPTPTAQQTVSAKQSTEPTTTVVQALHLADVLFKFDPDLMTTRTASDNIQTIRSNLGGADAGCPKTTVSGQDGLTVDFGTGCTVNGVTASGSLNLQVKLALGPPKTVEVSITLTSLVVNGWDLAGTAHFSTTGNTTLTVMLALSHAGTSFSFNGTVVGSPGSMTI